MNNQTSEQRRDEILLRLLKTPPQPRPKRDRSEGNGGMPKAKAPKRVASKKRVPKDEQ